MRFPSNRFHLAAAVAAVALFAAVAPARAEMAEINVAQQYGISYLPLMIMEDQKLIEKHAKAAGRRRQGRLGEVRGRQRDERRAAVQQPAVRVGRRRAAAHAVVAHQRQPRREGGRRHQLDAALPQHAQPERQVAQGLHGQGQDRAARGQGVDPGGDAADGGGEGVRAGPAEQARCADRLDVAPRRADGAAVRRRRDHRALQLAAVPVPAAREAGHPHRGQLVRRAGRPRDVQRRVDVVEVPEREPEALRCVREGDGGSDGRSSTATRRPPRRRTCAWPRARTRSPTSRRCWTTRTSSTRRRRRAS